MDKYQLAVYQQNAGESKEMCSSYEMLALFTLYFISLVYAQTEFPSGCIDEQDIEIIYVDQDVDFDQAILVCTQLVPTATLATLFNNFLQNFAFDFVSSVTSGGDNNNQPWMGLRRVLDNELPQDTNFSDPNLFEFIDGTPLEQQTFGVFPWRANRPNNAGGNETCA